MIFWILAAVLTVVAVVAVIRPVLAPRHPPADRADHDLEVYRAQLSELDRDLTRGLIGSAEAEAAKLEVARRMLAADRARAVPQAAAAMAGGRRLAWALTLALPLGCLGLYLVLGAPELPSQPLALRDPTERLAVQAQVTAAETLARELRDNPDDLHGWIDLGGRYTGLGRYAEAAEAYGRAVGLSDGAPQIVAAYAVALVDAAGGTVAGPAVAAFEQVLAALPDDPRARFYLALAEAQAGDLQAALDGWSALMADSPVDAPWVPLTRSQIAITAGQLGLDVASIMPEPLPATGGPATTVVPGIDPDQADAIAALDPEARETMVRGMVDRLAARLEEDPADVDGWMRLADAYAVLGEPEQAIDALGRAATAAPDDPVVLRTYADALLHHHGADVPPIFQQTIEALYAVSPDDPRALWVLGTAAAQAGEHDRAVELLGRLREQFPEDSPERGLVEQQIDAVLGG